MHGSGHRRPWRSLLAQIGLGLLVLVAWPVTAMASENRSERPLGRVAVSLPVWDSAYHWDDGHGYVGWRPQTLAGDPFAYSFAEGLAGRPGLWLWLTGDREYRPGAGEFVFHAPGTTRIASAALRVSYRDKLFAHHCLELGLRVGSATQAADRHCKPPEDPASVDRYDVSLADPSDRPTSKEAYLRVEMPVCSNPADTPCSKHIPALDPVRNGPMARLDQVDMVLVDDDVPVVLASGSLADLAGLYIDGSAEYAATVSASDAGAGISTTRLELVGERSLGDRAASCDPTHHTASLGGAICPPEDSHEFGLDTRALAEGRHVVLASAADPAGNRGTATPWEFFIDRTAPTPPSGTVFETEDGSAQAAWDASADPVLADGSPGSGVAGYRARHRIEDGPWFDWEVLAPDDLGTSPLDDVPAGTSVHFEIESFDAVGNRSAPVEVSGIVESTPGDVDGTGLIRTSVEVFSQEGEHTSTGCSFPDPAPLVLGPDQYGVYENEIDVSLESCVRTLDRGVMDPALTPEDEAQRLRFLGIKGDPIDPPAIAKPVVDPGSPSAVRVSQSLIAKEAKARYIQVVKAGVDIGDKEIGFQQWKTITSTRWVYDWNGNGTGVGVFPASVTPYLYDIRPRRLLGWSQKHDPVTDVRTSENKIDFDLHAHGTVKVGPLYKGLIKKLVARRAPGWVIDVLFKAVDKATSCRIEIEEEDHNTDAKGDGTFVASKTNPEISYHGGILGVCKLAGLLDDVSPVRLFHQRAIVRQYDRFYRSF